MKQNAEEVTHETNCPSRLYVFALWSHLESASGRGLALCEVPDSVLGQSAGEYRTEAHQNEGITL